MDFRLYARVLWRFKIIVVLGFVLAVALAILSVVRVSSHGLTYRDSQLWSSEDATAGHAKRLPGGPSLRAAVGGLRHHRGHA